MLWLNSKLICKSALIQYISENAVSGNTETAFFFEIEMLRVLILLIISVNITYSRQMDEETLPIMVKDQISCFKYKFNKGDSLIYSAVSHDSIIVDDNEPLIKNRFERYLIVCDSVKQNRYFITLSMIDYLSNEYITGNDLIERKDSEWLGRKVNIELDSLGKRYSINVDDHTKFAVSPAGVFAPSHIIDFGSSCHKINESWNSNILNYLPENAVPLPAIRQSFLFRALDPVDTLGRHCNKLEYISTSQGTFIASDSVNSIKNTSVINGFGLIYIDSVYNIPVTHYMTAEIKLKHSLNNGQEKPIWHYISSTYSLEKYFIGPIKGDKPANGSLMKKRKK
jgi:hypothetical protein